MRFWLSVATLVGTIVGVGIFGLPAVIAEAGWGGMLAVVIVGVPVVMLTHMAYAHVVLLTLKRRRLPGYAAEWLGKGAQRPAFFSQIVGLVGSALAYLIVGGVFLSQLVRLFTSFPDWAGIGIFFVACAMLVWRGAKSIAETELVMITIMLTAVVLLAAIAAPQWGWQNIANVAGGGGPWRAYGVLLFSLWGMAVIPEAAELIPRRRIGTMVAVSILLSLIVSALFVVVVMGVTNGQVSDDALSSLVARLGRPAQIFAYAFGILTTFTSYLTLSRTTVDTLTLDCRIPAAPAFCLALGVPLILLMAGLHDFVTIMAVTGAVSLGIEGILALVIERKALAAHPRGKILHIPPVLRTVVVTCLFIGIVIELLATFGVV